MSDQVDKTSPNHIELFVKASVDGTSIGGCPVCQRIFMILLVKRDAGNVTFTLTTVSMARPPDIFKKVASRLPALVHGEEIISDPDEIISYIDSHFHDPPMAYNNIQANNACMDVFSKFSFYVKDVAHSSAALVAELQKLNSYLEDSSHRYLCRDGVPDHLDCMMLPKLQHIRVIAKAFKDFEIPSNLKGLWRYLKNAYESPFFAPTCPSDQEIMRHWLDKKECENLIRDKKIMFVLEGPTCYSFGCP